MQSTTGNFLYALQDVPDKGKGLVAIEKISKGTRIISEEPIITIRNASNSKRLRKSIRQQVDALSENQRQAFLSMYNIHKYKNPTEQYLGIIRTNALPIETTGIEGGVFLEACRINHACDNNAQKNWNENIKRHTVHAIRDIQKGEEITIYYIVDHKNHEARREALQEKFGFTRLCSLCSLQLDQSRESDRRLDEIYRLDDLIGQGGKAGILLNPLQRLRYLDQQVQLYSEQGVNYTGLSRAFFNAAQVTIANGDLARGSVFVERAVSTWRTAFGADSKEVIEYEALAQDPSKHELYGLSTKWRTKADETPRGVQLSDFEDWLWKREKPSRPKCAKCANCGTLSSSRCKGCIDAPEYDSGDADGIFYCNHDCHTTHWPNHKAHCNLMQRRKMLLRIAMILKATLLAYRECVFDVNIERIEFREGVLYLYQVLKLGNPYHTRFPNHLTANVDYKKAALANNQCSLAMALLGPLARQLLIGVSSSIEILDLSIKRPLFFTKLVSGLGRLSSYVPKHTVLIVELRNNQINNEKWIIETAGCQFGFRDVLVPFDKYLKENVCYDVEPSQHYDANETKDIDYIMTFPSMIATAEARKNLMEQRAARLHFAAFVKTCILKREQFAP